MSSITCVNIPENMTVSQSMCVWLCDCDCVLMYVSETVSEYDHDYVSLCVKLTLCVLGYVCICDYDSVCV